MRRARTERCVFIFIFRPGTPGSRRPGPRSEEGPGLQTVFFSHPSKAAVGLRSARDVRCYLRVRRYGLRRRAGAPPFLDLRPGDVVGAVAAVRQRDHGERPTKRNAPRRVFIPAPFAGVRRRIAARPRANIPSTGPPVVFSFESGFGRGFVTGGSMILAFETLRLLDLDTRELFTRGQPFPFRRKLSPSSSSWSASDRRHCSKAELQAALRPEYVRVRDESRQPRGRAPLRARRLTRSCHADRADRPPLRLCLLLRGGGHEAKPPSRPEAGIAAYRHDFREAGDRSASGREHHRARAFGGRLDQRGVGVAAPCPRGRRRGRQCGWKTWEARTGLPRGRARPRPTRWRMARSSSWERSSLPCGTTAPIPPARRVPDARKAERSG